MPIDASIYSQIQQPKPVNALSNMAGAYELQGAIQKNQLGNLQLQEHQRGLDESRGINDAYKTALGADGTIDRNALYRGIASGGYGSKLPAIQKQFQEQDAAAASLDKTKLEATAKRIDLVGQGARFVMDNPTPEVAHSAIDFWTQSGIINPQQAAQYKAQVAANPTQIGTLAQQLFRQAISAKDQLGKIETRNIGGQTQTAMIDPLTGQTKVTNVVQNTQSPDSVASVAASIENNKRSVGATLANASATREVAKATRDAASIQRDRETEMKLADDYRAQSKAFKEVGDAYKTINATLDQATKSPAATLAGATKFMKLLDPGSVVRESELGMALAATGVFDRATNYLNTLQSGRVLTPNQVRDFKDITSKIYQAAQQQQQTIDANYKQTAQTYGLRPETIVQDLGQNAQPAKPSSAKVVNFGDLK